MKDEKIIEMNEKRKDDLSRKLFGVSFTEAREKGYCVFCRQEIKVFRDKLSEAENKISGLCQKCQDETFGEDE